MIKKKITPDHLSWLIPGFVSMAQDTFDENGVSLWDALHDFVRLHNDRCSVTGIDKRNLLVLYPKFSFDLDTKTATLERIFWVTNEVCDLMMSCFLPKMTSMSKRRFFSTNVTKHASVNKFKDIELFVNHNHVLPEEAKETLLRYSYKRLLSQKSLFFHFCCNHSKNSVMCNYDLSLLFHSHFLQTAKNESFQKILPPTLMVELEVTVDFAAIDIPQSLKEQQLIRES